MTLNDRAVSEEVASILLIAVVVTVIGLFSVNLFSGFQTTLPPAVDLRYSNTSDMVYLSHAGGDPVDRDHLHIYVDGEEVTEDMELISSGAPPPDWTTLTNGMTLRYQTDNPEGVMVIYSGPEVEEVLYTAGAVSGPISVPTASPTATTTETETPTPTATTATPTPTETATPGAVPVADFTADPTNGTRPLTVQFT
ncbi:MAG: type IV pilin N-terminal domain-containing protein, partial [Methanomicrobiales archaeon]